jgi:glycosyltransferase involved in cell wall biosynthesis
MNEPIPIPITNRSSRSWPWNVSGRPGIQPPRSGIREERGPVISVVIPSYNQGKFLEAAIRSVLLQGYPQDRVECFVMDGGSADASRRILEYYGPWLAGWVSERDGGQAQAVNKGIALASGDILGWLNSDDMYAPGAFRRVARAFRADPDCLVVHGDRILMDEDGHVSGWAVLPPFDPDKTGYNVCSETAFWRRSGAADARLKETLRFAMDLEFFCRLHQRGRFVKLNACLGYFRCHAESKSSTLHEVGQEEARREWKTLFGEHHEGWKLRPPTSRARQISQLFLHPRLVTFPYLYRRLILARRGL